MRRVCVSGLFERAREIFDDLQYMGQPQAQGGPKGLLDCG